MALTLEEMQGYLDELYRCLFDGTLSVKYGETASSFRTVDELKEQIRILEGKIRAMSAEGTSTKRPRYIRQEVR